MTPSSFDAFTKSAVDAHYEWLTELARPRRDRKGQVTRQHRQPGRRVARALHLVH